MKLIVNKYYIHIYVCKRFLARLKSYMYKKKIDHAIFFNKCNSIHTFFMKTNIDVIMCDKNYKVLYFYKNLPKNRIILPKKNVYIVIETPSNYFNVKVHDIIKMEE